jgi:hypothetical protein
MVWPELIEGTGEELQQMLEHFPKSRFRLVPLPVTETQDEQSDAIAEGDSLYDLLGD